MVDVIEGMEVHDHTYSDEQVVHCWGRTACGELGVAGDGENNVRLPTAFPWPNGKNDIVEIACGKQHSVFLLETGLVYSCGANDKKQLGRDGNTSVPEIIPMTKNRRIIQVSCGDYFTIVRTADKCLYGFGANDKGQLGSNPCSSIQEPLIVGDSHPLMNVVQVVCGAKHCLALTSNGKIFSWGDNENGQLGLGSNSKQSATPSEVKALSNLPIYMLAAGGGHSLALTVSGTLFAWGKNSFGQLGHGDEQDRDVPTLVRSLRSKYVTYVCCGDNHTAVLTKFGHIFTFGCGKQGQLGHGNTGKETYPKQTFFKGNLSCLFGLSYPYPLVKNLIEDQGSIISTLKWKIFAKANLKVVEATDGSVLQIACGSYHTLALVEGNGNLYSFGSNKHGQLGITERAPSQRTPVRVKGDWKNTNSKHEMHTAKIFAGGNQNFVILRHQKSCKLRCNQREMVLDDRTTSFLDDSKVDDLLKQYEGDDSQKKDVINLVKAVFSSPSCLNGSFLNPETHEITGFKNHGLDIRPCDKKHRVVMLRRILQKLRKHEPIVKKITSSLFIMLREVTGVPADIEALRLFLIIPEVISDVKKPKNLELIAKFGEKILEQKKEAIKIICTWWSVLPQSLFLGIVRLFKACVRNIVQSFETSSRDENKMKDLQTSLCILALLNKVNDEVNHKIPYDLFYLPIMQKIEIFKDVLLFMNDQNAFTFCKFPFIFDAKVKSDILKAHSQISMDLIINETLMQNTAAIMRYIERPFSSPYLVFVIRRGFLVNDTLRHIEDIREIYGTSTREFQKPLKIVFENEKGIDWGGPRKEFFLLLIEEIFDNKYGMFKTIEDSEKVWFNRQSFEDPELYYLIGVICGLALYNSIIIDVHFPPVLYKKLLKQKTSFSDFRTYDPNYARTLEYLLDYPKVNGEDVREDIEEEVGTVEDTFCLNFQVEEERFGETVFIDLIENGKETDVDENNRQQYVDLLVDYHLNKSIKQQYEKFEEGFYSVCNRQFLMSIMHPNELMELICGCEDYDDFMKLKENTEYANGYHKDHPRIIEFWEILENFDVELKKKFLAFLTGSDKIPIHGIKSMKIKISAVGEEDETLQLPSAATCFNHLTLPRYRKGVMEERLRFALEHFSKGFGLE